MPNAKQLFHRYYLYNHILSKTKPTDSVLEIGPGSPDGPQSNGPIWLNSIAKDYTAIGVDDWPDAPFEYINVDFMKHWTYHIKRYDKIVALYVAQYVNIVDMFRYAWKHLKPGGKFYMSEGLRLHKDEPKLDPIRCYEIIDAIAPIFFDNYFTFFIKNGIPVKFTDRITGIGCIARK